MSYMRLFFSVLIISLALAIPIAMFAADIETLLNDGKSAIENGKYEDAVNCLGELLTASGNQSNDPKVIAFGSTVQAYGMMRLNNPEMDSLIKQYLAKAIKNDPAWAFPKELLKKVK